MHMYDGLQMLLEMLQRRYKTPWIMALNVMPCCLHLNARVGTYVLNLCALMHVGSVDVNLFQEI